MGRRALGDTLATACAVGVIARPAMPNGMSNDNVKWSLALGILFPMRP